MLGVTDSDGRQVISRSGAGWQETTAALGFSDIIYLRVSAAPLQLSMTRKDLWLIVAGVSDFSREDGNTDILRNHLIFKCWQLIKKSLNIGPTLQWPEKIIWRQSSAKRTTVNPCIFLSLSSNLDTCNNILLQ